MNNISPFVPGPRRTEHRPRVRPSWLLVLVVGGCLAVLGASGYLVLHRPGGGVPPTMVLDQPGMTVLGQRIDRPVEITADGITLRQVVIVAAGKAAVTVRPGVHGTLVEASEIYCTGEATDGIGPGEYTAVRVDTRGCARPFAQHPDAPATVVDCHADGQPYQRAGPPGIVVAADPPDLAALEGPPPSAAPAARMAPPVPLSDWPGPTTTGVPAGTALTPSGPLDLRRDGQVVSGLDIRGCVTVRARDVTIRASRITCASPAFSVRLLGGANNLLLEDVEIDGGGRNAAVICCSDYTLRRVDAHNAVDGPRLGSRSTVVDSWIHDLSRTPSSHNDTLQTTGGSDITVRNNRLDSYRADRADPMNACLMIGSLRGRDVRNLLVEGNYCNGGNWSLGVRADLDGSRILIRGNTFGRDFRYGVVARPNQPGITWDRRSNVWFDTGRPVLP